VLSATTFPVKGSSFFRNILQINRWYPKPCVKYWHSDARWMKAGGQVLVTCYLFLAHTLMLENKQDGAIATFRTGLKLKPGMTVARCDLAAALFSTGRWREAETELETGPAHNATEPDLHCPPAMARPCKASTSGPGNSAPKRCALLLIFPPST